MEDEWRARLAAELLGEDDAPPVSQRATFAPEGATAMEIAFGQARSELTYVLELGRAHHLPVLGAVVGDEIWIRLGESKVAFRLDRQATAIHTNIAGADGALTWDAKGRAIVTSAGKAVDMQSFVQGAIDVTVRAFKAKSE
jgi:hypothetical protein